MELSSVKTGVVSGDGVVLELTTSKPDDSTCDSQLISATNLSVENQSKAIQLILAKTYGYAPQQIKRDFPGWFYFLIFGGLAYCIAFSFTPKISLAIGLGEKKVQFWRKYSTFILITTPAFIFSTFLWPKIETILIAIF